VHETVTLGMWLLGAIGVFAVVIGAIVGGVIGHGLGFRRAYSELQIHVQPFDEVDVGFFGSTVVAGYTMQLHVRGMPVLSPQRVVVKHERRVNEERVAQVVRISVELAREIADSAERDNLPIRVVALIGDALRRLECGDSDQPPG